MKCAAFYIGVGLFFTSTVIGGALAAENAPADVPDTAGVKTFLQDYLAQRFGPDETTRYSAAFVSLSGRADKEVIVYVMGGRWCGSGGCTTLILQKKDGKYKIVTKLTIVNRPIRILDSVSNGWHDLGVLVRGGGVDAPHEALLPFNGVKYPGNPSVPPARPLPEGAAKGEVVIPSTDDPGETLYD